MIDLVFRYDPDARREERDVTDSAVARELLRRGNATFAGIAADGEHARHVIPVIGRDLGFIATSGDAPPQKPFALVLGCADARVPIELLFLKGAGDLFVLRVAGNVLGDTILGSIDYALGNLPTVRLVLVLGHTGCGAVSASVDAFIDPANYLALASNHQLRGIVNHILPAVRVAFEAIIDVHGAGARFLPGFRKALLDVSVPVNAALVAGTLQHEVQAGGFTDVEVVWSVYDIAARTVCLPGDEPGHTHLLDPIKGARGFAELAREMASSPAVTALLRDDAG